MEDVYQTEMDRIYHETFAPRVDIHLSEDAEKVVFENEKEWLKSYVGKVKHVGDHNWRKAEMISGGGDYKYGSDEGEPPHNE